MNKFVCIACVLAVVVTAGCGDRGPRKRKGVACKAGYNPLPISVDGNAPKGLSKVSLESKTANKATNELGLEDGTYEYAGADYFYRDPNSDIMIHVRQVKAEGGNFVDVRVCNYGLAADKSVSTTTVSGIASMIVAKENTGTDLELIEYSVGFSEHEIHQAVSEAGKEVISPKEFFLGLDPNFKVDKNYRLFKATRSEKEKIFHDYELRTKIVDKDGVELFLAIKYELKSTVSP